MPTGHKLASHADHRNVTVSDSDIANLPILDPKTLLDLAEELSPSAVQEYLRIFLTQATSRLEEIKRLVAAGDSDRVAYLSHDLVSTAGNLGALQMSVTARALARSCKIGDSKRAGLFLNDFALATYASCLEIQKWLVSQERQAPYQGPERRRVDKKVAKDRRNVRRSAP